MAEDQVLSGGNSAAEVIRKGDTVRKPPTPFDQAITALLDMLAADKVAGVPRALGYDDDGKRILSWVDGDTAFPTNLWTENTTLVTAAKMLRRIHDASAPQVRQDLTWAYRYPDRAKHEVICHNDFAPYNMTFASDGETIGVFDFDLAGPGPRLRDLAYLAWWMVPLGRNDPEMARATDSDILNESQRLKRLCTTYGVTANPALLDMITHVLNHMSDQDAAARMIGAEAAAALARDGHLAHWRQASEDFSTLKARIQANLGHPQSD